MANMRNFMESLKKEILKILFRFERLEKIILLLLSSYSYLDKNNKELYIISNLDSNVINEYKITDEEIKIIRETKLFNEIVEKLMKNEIDKMKLYKNFGSFIDVINSENFMNKNEKYVIENKYPSFIFELAQNTYNQTIYEISQDFRQKLYELTEDYKNNLINYKPPQSIRLIFTILRTTVNASLQEIRQKNELDNDDIRKYKLYLLDIISRWEQIALNSKPSNRVALALTNLLDYADIKDNIIFDLKEMIKILSKKFFNLDENEFLVFLLMATFRSTIQNPDRYTSIKRLCISIMHPQTYKKYKNNLK